MDRSKRDDKRSRIAREYAPIDEREKKDRVWCADEVVEGALKELKRYERKYMPKLL